MKHLYTVVLTLWMYCSAIFYPVEQLQGFIRLVIQVNPLYVYIHCMRGAVMTGELPGMIEWVQMVLWGAGICLLGVVVFRKKRNSIMQRL